MSRFAPRSSCPCDYSTTDLIYPLDQQRVMTPIVISCLQWADGVRKSNHEKALFSLHLEGSLSEMLLLFFLNAYSYIFSQAILYSISCISCSFAHFCGLVWEKHQHLMDQTFGLHLCRCPGCEILHTPLSIIPFPSHSFSSELSFLWL